MPGEYEWMPDASGTVPRGLPNNPEAEATVLAAMLLSPEAAIDALATLRPEDFYRPANRVLFSALADMNERTIPIDSISLIDFLNSEDKLAQVGGEA